MDASDRGVEFRILGPLEVVASGEPLPLGGGRQNALLALLLTTPGEVASRDRLIDALWETDPPETAANILQVYVSQLRKVLPEGTIVTRPPGYVAQLGRSQLDLHRFEQLTEEGTGLLESDPDAAAALLREGLTLWRGTPFGEFAYETWASNAIARLEELRLVALERRIEADIALGRHAEVIPELEALIREHPLRERLRAHLMLALYRSGRQADALDVYQAARRTLVEQLGIDPGQPLQQLEQAILRHDPSLEGDGAGARPAASRPPPEPEVALPEVDRAILVVPSTDAALAPLLELAESLARTPPRELIVTRLLGGDDDLAAATALVRDRRVALVARGIPTRGAAFTSDSLGDDTVRLAGKQDVDLTLLDAPSSLASRGAFDDDTSTILATAPCDVAFLTVHGDRSPAPGPDRPVIVPFGGADHEWAAIELASWLAGSTGASLRLLGTSADREAGQRDASRLLASASLMVQQLAGVDTEPLLVEPGGDAVIEASSEAGLVLVGLSPGWKQDGLGESRETILRDSRAPVLLVRRGLRPGGLAPQESMTRFTWTLAGASRR